MKIVLDTNVFVSGVFFRGPPAQILEAWRDGKLVPAVSAPILEDYFDWEKSVPGSFPALKPSTQTISLRLPKALLEELKTLANERDVPYQSLLKVFLAERVARERGRKRSRSKADA